MGPRSRELLQKVSTADFSNAAFPFGAIREIGVGYATVLASRRTYMGELGWELYVPTEFAVTVYETLHRGRRATSACAMPATTRSNRCASRRPIAPGAAS